MLLKEKAYYWNNGSFYYGQWMNNKINGVGILINHQNVIFGQFNSGLLHGYCQFIYSNKHSYSRYENGQQIGAIKYEYFNGEITIDKTQPTSQEEIDIIDQLDHHYFVLNYNYLVDNVENTATNLEDCVGNSNIFHKRIEIGLLYDFSGRFEYGYFLNQVQDGKGGIVFETGDRYVGEFKNGRLHGIGIFYNNKQNQYTQSKFDDNKIIEIIKQSQDQILPRSQWHQMPEPELVKDKNYLTPKKQNQNYYSFKNTSNKLSKSVSPMRPTVSIKRQAMFSQIKNYPNPECKFGSIQSHFGREEIKIILPYKSRQVNSYIKSLHTIDDICKDNLRTQLFDDREQLLN